MARNNRQFDYNEESDVFSTVSEFRIDRSVYNELQFSKSFKKPTKEDSIKAKVQGFFANLKCSRSTLLGFILSVLPVLKWLPKYNVKKDLVRDLAGGLTVGIMQIPQGMAYAMLTTLPPIYGLYVSFVPVIVYFIFGTSRHISLGTFAIVCLMNGEIIESMASNYRPASVDSSNTINNTLNSTASSNQQILIDAYRVEVAVALSCIVGIVQVGLGIIRLGFVTMYLSDPLISGFTTGAAFHILSSQVRHFLGLTVPSGTNSGYFGLFKLYIYFFTHIKEVNVSSLITGIICAIILYSLKFLNQKYKLKFPIPAELIVVALGAGISYGANFNVRFGTPILKTVPKGMPALTVPSFSLMGDLISQSFIIAIVAFAINVSLAKSFAKKNNYDIDPNQELIAYGLSNAASSFFSCFPSAASLSRSVIQESLGSTQVCGFISVALVLLVLFSLAPLFEPLPNAVLAAIVLVALKGLFKQFTVLKLLWKISKIDAFIWFTSFLAVFCLGVDTGLAVGLVITLLSVVARTSKPSLSVLGSVPGTEVYRRVEKYHVRQIPGVKILRYSASLYYANIEHFLLMLSMQVKNDDDRREDSGNKLRFNDYSFDKSDTIFDVVDSDKNSYNMNRYQNGNGYAGKSNEDDKTETHSKPSNFTSAVKRSNSLPPSLSSFLPTKRFHHHFSAFKEEPLHSIVLDCSRFNFIDSMGVSTLGNVVDDYKKSDIEVYLACCSESVLSMLDSGGFFATHGKGRLFVTVHDAVLHSTSTQNLKSNISAENGSVEEGEENDDSQRYTVEIEVEDESIRQGDASPTT